MKKLKKYLAPLLTFTGIILCSGNANAAFSEFNLDVGVSRMLTLHNRCDYRMYLRNSSSSLSGVLTNYTYFPFNERIQWAASSSSSTSQFKFDISREQRFSLVSFIPANGQLSFGGLLYAGSNNQAEYSAYVSESDEKNYNCSISISTVARGKRVVPALSCTRRNGDAVNSLEFVVNPTNIRVQEDC